MYEDIEASTPSYQNQTTSSHYETQYETLGDSNPGAVTPETPTVPGGNMWQVGAESGVTSSENVVTSSENAASSPEALMKLGSMCASIVMVNGGSGGAVSSAKR